MFGPGCHITGEGVPEPPPRNLQPARPPRGRRAFAGLLGGCSACSSSRADRPLLRRLRVHHPTTSFRNTPASSSGRGLPAVQSLRSSRTRPVASPTTEMLRTFLSTTSQSETRYASSPVKTSRRRRRRRRENPRSTSRSPPASPSPKRKTEGDEVIGGASTRPGRYSSR